METQLKVGDVIHFRELTDKEEKTDAWGDDWFFAGKTFQVVNKGDDYYCLYCSDLPEPFGVFDSTFIVSSSTFASK